MAAIEPNAPGFILESALEDALWRLPKVLAIVGLSRSSLYRAINEGRFPRPVRLGPRAVAWRKSTVLAFINRLPEKM